MQSLRTRVALFLSIAILPLGIIAVIQTASVVDDAQALEEQDILFRTTQAADSQQALLRRALGGAVALGHTALALSDDPDRCDAIMEDFVETSNAFTFAGYIPVDGVMTCHSGDGTLDVSENEGWQRFLASEATTYTVNETAQVSGQSVLIVTVPVRDGDTLIGGVAVSVPHSLADTLMAVQSEGAHLALLDAAGTILSASTGIGAVEEFRELDIPFFLSDSPDLGNTFRVTMSDGSERVAAVVPIIRGEIYALGLWDVAVAQYSLPRLGSAAPLIPLLMWLAALAVGVLAVDRLVLRPLNTLRKRMARFSAEKPRDGIATLDHAPAEVMQIAETYNRMIDRILTDRAHLEGLLADKELLLREVHHRVKNNLQLIASILNMQLRTVPDGQAKHVLRRIQDRVMSLASIHKALYTGADMSSVRADRLLEEVVSSVFRMGLPARSGVRTTYTADPLELDPDQAVPLALLANEAVTNALKYLGRPDEGQPEVTVTLRAGDGDLVMLSIHNTVGTPVQEQTPGGTTGLGARLIEAFAGQLGGEVVVTSDGDGYDLTLEFEVLHPAQDLIGDDRPDPDPAAP